MSRSNNFQVIANSKELENINRKVYAFINKSENTNYMKPNRLKLIFSFIVCSLSIQAQTVILHPVVGDTIDLTEKKAYLLFPQFADSIFHQAWIEKKDGILNLHTTMKGEVIVSVIDTIEIAEFKMHIEKLSAYYASQGHSDSIYGTSGSIVIRNKTGTDEKRSYELSPEMMDKIKRDARRYAELNHEAQMQGLTGRAKEDFINTAGHMEIRIEPHKK